MRQSSTLKQPNAKKSMTDWKRVRAMRDEAIDLSDSPEATPEEFARAVIKRGGVVMQSEKEQISIRLDKDMLEWFRARGKGYQREINALLRAYMEAHQSK